MKRTVVNILSSLLYPTSTSYFLFEPAHTAAAACHLNLDLQSMLLVLACTIAFAVFAGWSIWDLQEHHTFEDQSQIRRRANSRLPI